MIPCTSTVDLFHYLELWFRESIFPTYSNLKTIVKTKILENEADDWFRFCSDHPSMRVAQTCLENISPYQFWSIADRYPDLVSRLHVQIRLMGNFGFNDSVTWHTNTDDDLCLSCKNSVEDVSHFLSVCSSFRDNFECLWSNLSQKIIACNLSDGIQISHFIRSLDRQQKIILLLGGLLLPFDGVTVTMINRFTSSAVSKIHRSRKKMLRELDAP